MPTNRSVSERHQEPVKPKKFTVLLEARQSERFDAYCRDRGFKKSTLVARLIREHLDSEGFGTKNSQREPV